MSRNSGFPFPFARKKWRVTLFSKGTRMAFVLTDLSLWFCSGEIQDLVAVEFHSFPDHTWAKQPQPQHRHGRKRRQRRREMDLLWNSVFSAQVSHRPRLGIWHRCRKIFHIANAEKSRLVCVDQITLLGLMSYSLWKLIANDPITWQQVKAFKEVDLVRRLEPLFR